ncbi:hypothetical protein [Vibrio aphrogenes]|uniref:hypothetical protein n=1 Tax=Vibrio aphrogenes TaxID=1891186 RepID=UPI000B34D105|nr:hypothetical protein [Vibrio aphrogenes]
MKRYLLAMFIAASLMGCGGGEGSESSPEPDKPITPIDPETPTDNAALLSECENSGCVLETDITAQTLTVSTAPITLTSTASITLE